jgi:hypothetical protein
MTSITPSEGGTSSRGFFKLVGELFKLQMLMHEPVFRLSGVIWIDTRVDDVSVPIFLICLKSAPAVKSENFKCRYRSS